MNKIIQIVKISNNYLFYKVSYLHLWVKLCKYLCFIFLFYLFIYSLDFSIYAAPLYCDSGFDLPIGGENEPNTNITEKEHKEFLCFRFKFKDKCKFSWIKNKFTGLKDKYNAHKEHKIFMRHMNCGRGLR